MYATFLSCLLFLRLLPAVAFAAVVFGVDLIKMPDATRGIDFVLVFGP